MRLCNCDRKPMLACWVLLHRDARITAVRRKARTHASVISQDASIVGHRSHPRTPAISGKQGTRIKEKLHLRHNFAGFSYKRAWSLLAGLKHQ